MLKGMFAGLIPGRKRNWTVAEVRNLVKEGNLEGAKVAALRLFPQTPDKELIQMCLTSEICFRESRDVEAETGYRTVLQQAPGFPDAHYGLSLLLLEQGKLQAAIEHAQFARAIHTNDARYLAQYGLCCVVAGSYPAAENPLKKAVRLDANDKASWTNLGIVYRAKADIEQALACFQNALRIDTNYALAKQNYELLLVELGESGVAERFVPSASISPSPILQEAEAEEWELGWRHVESLRQKSQDAAVSAAEALCQAWPKEAGPVVRLSKLYTELGDTQAAIDVIQASLLGNPNSPEVLAALGRANLANNQNSQAEKYLSLAKTMGLDTAEINTELAQALCRQDKHIEALACWAQAAELNPTLQERAALAVGYGAACKYDEAIALFEELLEESPNIEGAIIAPYASAKAFSGDFDNALELMNKALAYNPHDAGLRMQRAQIHLLLGNFDQGWPDYAFRGLAGSKNFRTLPFTKWAGEPLQGKSIIVLAEQGLGDQVMFASCLPDLLELNPSRVVVEVIARVAPTLARSFPACEIISTRQDKKMDWAKEVGHVDFFVPLGDLPAIFRKHRNSFQPCIYLKPDPSRVEYWKEKLEKLSSGPWVGVTWRGGVQSTRQVVRTMTIEDIKPLLTGIPVVNWLCLQYGDVADDLAEAASMGIHLHYWPEAIQDLDEFTALIEAIDCVVTVCNTTVHYAGALGKPTWVLAPKIPEWRYGLSVDGMPWYTSVRVIRQSRASHWSDVIDKAALVLDDKFGK
jgi:Flp pilus assembly protein TadD